MVKSMTSNRVKTEDKRSERGIAARYATFCKAQEKQGMLWYLIPLMSMPAAIMPISIMAMSYFPGYIVFIAISMLIFFTNIALTIAEQPIKTKVSFFLITVLFHVAVPLAAFLFSFLN